jgi:4-hydroxy 2-oxovalerate aldolase
MLLLDCTIRDGGYVNDWNFTDEQIRQCYLACTNAGVDYIEIGFRNIKKPNFQEKYGKSFFSEEEYINRITDGIEGNTKIAVMVTINEFDIADFIEKKKSKISLVRVLMAYHGGKNGDDNVLDIHQLKAGVEQINQLIDLGYDVSFNVGRIDKISFEHLRELSEVLSLTKIKYFVMADTYGSVDLDYIEKLIPYVRSIFPDSIKIGFHAHDNCSNATVKALYSLKFGVDIIDGCVLGFGRGSGNAKTELLMMDLNKNHDGKYNVIDIIAYGDKYIMDYKECTNNLCYNVVYAMSAYLGCHVSYAIDVIEKLDKMDVRTIYTIFLELKKLNKHMFYYPEMFNTLIKAI